MNHLLRTEAAFFAGLENQFDSPVEPIAQLGDLHGGQQQGGGVSIVTTGVHQARLGRRVLGSRLFDDGQCVHVGTQCDGLARASRIQHADHTSADDAFSDFIAQATQFVGDARRGLVFLELQFGMSVKKSAQLDRLRNILLIKHKVSNFAGRVYRDVALKTAGQET